MSTKNSKTLAPTSKWNSEHTSQINKKKLSLSESQHSKRRKRLERKRQNFTLLRRDSQHLVTCT